MNKRSYLWLAAALMAAACTPTTGRPALTGDLEAQGVPPGNPAGGLSVFDTMLVKPRIGERQ